MPNFGEFADPDHVISLASRANDRGWDGLFLWDHALWFRPFRVEVSDSWLLLAAIAAATQRRPNDSQREPMRIGTLVTPLARRKPAEFARQVATLDRISGGRVTFGVGLGGPREELEALGEATSEKERARLLDASLSIIQRLWRGENVDEGDPFNYRQLRQAMTPLQQPVPIWGGGYYRGKAGTKMVARTARLDGAVLLGLAKESIPRPDGTLVDVEMPRRLSESEFEDVVTEVRTLRGDAGLDLAYDFAVWNDLDASDPEAYERLGATWWIEAPRRGENPEGAFDAMAAVIDAGPPSG